MAIHGADPTKLRLSCTYKPSEIMDKKIPTITSALSLHQHKINRDSAAPAYLLQ